MNVPCFLKDLNLNLFSLSLAIMNGLNYLIQFLKENWVKRKLNYSLDYFNLSNSRTISHL
jgi:hypothetical protein